MHLNKRLRKPPITLDLLPVCLLLPLPLSLCLPLPLPLSLSLYIYLSLENIFSEYTYPSFPPSSTSLSHFLPPPPPFLPDTSISKKNSFFFLLTWYQMSQVKCFLRSLSCQILRVVKYLLLFYFHQIPQVGNCIPPVIPYSRTSTKYQVVYYGGP